MLPTLSLATLLFSSTPARGQDAPEDSPPPPVDAEEAQDPDAEEAPDEPDDAEVAEPSAPETEDSAATTPAEPEGEDVAAEEGVGADASEEAPAVDEASPDEATSEEAAQSEAVVTEPTPAPPVSEAEEAEEAEPRAKASLIGSPRPQGLGLAPEAPPVGPAPGGRAPSFGTPLDPDDASLVISGNISAWQTSGFGRTPEDAGDAYSGPIVHTPPFVGGRAPFWRESEMSLYVTYGTPQVTGTLSFRASANGREYQGFYAPVNGATYGQAYLTLNPDPIGNLRLRFIMGAFTEVHAGPGEWGWGIFGPLIAMRGYGESTHFDYSLSRKLRLIGTAGVMGVPGVPEDTVRGDYAGWTDTGISTIAYHAHAGFNYEGKYIFRLHYAGATGTDEREYLVEEPRDGQMNVYAFDAHAYGVPWGHLGLSGGLWDFHDATGVHDAIWWGVKYTKGASDMLRDYVGTAGTGSGKVAAVSAEFNTSLARIAWHPRNFDGRSADVRISVGGVYHQTLETDDENFEGSNGYMAGLDLEYRMLRWLSFNVRSYAENREWRDERWGAYNVAPGLSVRSDWQSTDRIELWYSRHFYSDAVDNNSVQPLDQDVVALGVFLGF